MAPPFASFARTPGTAHYSPAVKTPRSMMSRTGQRAKISKRHISLIFILVIAILAWWCGAFSRKTPKQSDRIPFSPHVVDEQVPGFFHAKGVANNGP